MSKTDEEIKAELQKMLDESDDPEELISQWIDEVYGSNTQLKEYRLEPESELHRDSFPS